MKPDLLNEDHRCYRGLRCAAWERVDEQRMGAQINPSRGFCDTCTRHVSNAITELPTDYVELELVIAKQSGGGGEPVSGSRERPIPISTHVEALQRLLPFETSTWAELVAGLIGVTWDSNAMDRHARPGWVLQRAVGILSNSLSAFLALQPTPRRVWGHSGNLSYFEDQSGLDGALTLLDLHHRARAATGQRKLVHRLPAPCPRCDTQALERANGEDVIDCRACARRYSRDEYEKLCTLLARSREAS